MLTRRQVLERGAAAWLTAMLGGAASARAAGTDVTAPGYLRRAAWVPLAGTAVVVGGVSLRLADVADLPYLAGRDDAFRLELTGPPGAAGGIRRFRHPELGGFELFVAPVEAVTDGVQRYEVVVDRSVGVPRSVPQAPAAGAGAPSQPASAPAPTPAHRARRHRRKHVARRRRRRHLRARWKAVRGKANIAS